MEFRTIIEQVIVPERVWYTPAGWFGGRLRAARTEIEPEHIDPFKKVVGPCLVCESEIVYRMRNPPHDHLWPYGEEHARQQFKRGRRNALLRALRTGSRSAAPKVETIESMVCEHCRAKCAEQREINRRPRQLFIVGRERNHR